MKPKLDELRLLAKKYSVLAGKASGCRSIADGTAVLSGNIEKFLNGDKTALIKNISHEDIQRINSKTMNDLTGETSGPSSSMSAK